jgi:hypothetical protein
MIHSRKVPVALVHAVFGLIFVTQTLRGYSHSRVCPGTRGVSTLSNLQIPSKSCFGRYMKEMFASMEELGLPLPKDESVRVGDSPRMPSARQVSELPDSFERESSKFWLQRGQVVAFVDMVTQRLGPYKFKGQKDSFNVITSIYLDNDAFDLYASRVARRDGAQLVRFRW